MFCITVSNFSVYFTLKVWLIEKYQTRGFVIRITDLVIYQPSYSFVNVIYTCSPKVFKLTTTSKLLNLKSSSVAHSPMFFHLLDERNKNKSQSFVFA